ncbi:MAG: mechanosensitive ion channel family protein [Candidatus Thermoplasmatota archaeon]|nr:mechanosensitive ion channel family protein [Candidatus Thermoplasmatota archaeon]
MVDFLGFDIPLPPPFDEPWGQFMILLLIWIFVGLAVLLIVRPVLRKIFKDTETEVDEKILKIIGGPVIAFIFFYGFIQSMQVFPDMPDWFMDGLMRVYSLVVPFLVVYIAYKVFKAVFMPLGMEYSKKTESELDDVLVPLMDKLGGVLILMFGMFWIASTQGVNVTVFIAGFGIVGLVIAFAMQDTMANFFSGIFLMTDRPFKVGDTILIDGDYCRVEKIGLRTTWLYNRFDHDIIIFPNNEMAGSKIVNLTEPDNKFKVKAAVGVAYGSDLDQVQKIMIESMSKQPGVILDDPNRAPFVRFQEFGDSSLNFKVTAWIHDIFDQWKIAHNTRLEINRRFEEEGIEIPFPQRVVHMEPAK